MIPKSLKDITKADIDSLIQGQEIEHRTLEYKKELPGDSEKDKVEFLADVSSFANAAGGDLLYGVEEKDGKPWKAHGLIANIDEAKQRLENLHRSRIAPHLRLEMQPIEGFPNGPVLLVRVPKSWDAPHMIKHNEWMRFYTRNSAGKYPLNSEEIRSAYALSGELPERIRRWRDERLTKITMGETPVLLPTAPKLVVHLIPLNSFDPQINLSIADLHTCTSKMQPIMAQKGWNDRINVDGWVTFWPRVDQGLSYSQMFRMGRIESVNAYISAEGTKYISEYEPAVIDAVESYFQTLQTLNVPYPLSIMTSMLSVLGYHMYVKEAVRWKIVTYPIDRDILLLPDILLYEPPTNVGAMLRPVFDAIWNACGYKGSPNYDKDGKWVEDKR